MPRNRKSNSNGTALATVEPPALPTISRSEANNLLKQRAQDLYHEARAEREDRIRQFETEYGRADRIDHTLLRDLQAPADAIRSDRRASVQVRRRQPRAEGLEVHQAARRHHRRTQLASGDRARLGTLRTGRGTRLQGREPAGTIGRKGLDDSILDQLQRDRRSRSGPKNVTPTPIYFKTRTKSASTATRVSSRYEDDPSRGACAECGEEFDLVTAGNTEDK